MHQSASLAQVTVPIRYTVEYHSNRLARGDGKPSTRNG